MGDGQPEMAETPFRFRGQLDTQPAFAVADPDDPAVDPDVCAANGLRQEPQEIRVRVSHFLVNDVFILRHQLIPGGGWRAVATRRLSIN